MTARLPSGDYIWLRTDHTAPFHDRPDAEATQRIQLIKRKPKKRLIDSVAILKRAVSAYYLPIRLEGLLILQRAQRLVGREKVLYSGLSCTCVAGTI
jgi:hypothetical protein